MYFKCPGFCPRVILHVLQMSWSLPRYPLRCTPIVLVFCHNVILDEFELPWSSDSKLSFIEGGCAERWAGGLW